MKPTVVFQTDFGSGGGGVLAGVVKSIDPEVGVYDFDHNIEPFNVRMASYQLSSIVDWWPMGTIFVSVVDPGVGTKRRSCVALLDNGCYVVTPDNGTLTALAEKIAEVREISPEHRMPGTENVHIFNGRDVYAYTAGKLAADVITFAEVGEAYEVSDLVRVPLTNIKPVCKEGFAEGGIYNFDLGYGSARVNIRNEVFQHVCGFAYGDRVEVSITEGDRVVFADRAAYERSFGFVESGAPFICGDIQPGPAQLLRFSINDRNFIEEYCPELAFNSAGAVNYVFRVRKIESEEVVETGDLSTRNFDVKLANMSAWRTALDA